MPRKVISFDGDNTLWDFERAQRHALRSVLNLMIELGAAPNLLDVERMIAIRHEVGAEWSDDSVSLLALRRESLRRAVVEAQLEPDDSITERLFDLFVAERDRANRPYPDVSDMLGRLKSDAWTVVLLTNGNANASTTGLDRFFDHLFYAEEIGFRKPDIAAFRTVADATDIQLSELVHVGDSLEHDVAGANTAGATSIWINRTGHSSCADIKPDFEIATMTELPAVLDSLR